MEDAADGDSDDRNPSPSPFQLPVEERPVVGQQDDEVMLAPQPPEERRGSRQTVVEPEVERPNEADLEELLDAESEQVARSSMSTSVAQNERLDGISLDKRLMQ